MRRQTEAPIVIGGCGYSLFAGELLLASGADYGIRGDGEAAFLSLLEALGRGGDLADVPGLVWRDGEEVVSNAPSRAALLTLPTGRDVVDNPRYLREGGQCGLETKRGCDRRCAYCADPLIKGAIARTRQPAEVADEAEALLARGVDVLHLCDSEFNIPPEHALAVCEEFARRGLGGRLRWYTYAAPVPFTGELAAAMREAGCVGVNFGADSASEKMLATYGRRHRKEDIEQAVSLCRREGLRVMLDLLLGGPGEDEGTVRETIQFTKAIEPDCVGAALGVRLYPGTPLTARLAAEGPLAENPNLRFRGELSGTLLTPVFYISRDLGGSPAQLVRDIIGGDERFFAPVEEQSAENYNYNDNTVLVEAIRRGARGAYWDILRRIRSGELGGAEDERGDV